MVKVSKTDYVTQKEMLNKYLRKQIDYQGDNVIKKTIKKVIL